MKLDNDFSDLLHESRSERFFDRIKPLINVTVVVAVLIGLVYGSVLLFGGGTKPKDDSVTTASSITNEDNKKLSDCLVGVNGDHPVPGSSDTGFYPKLIAGYDAQLSCYDKHPGADNVVSRSSIEYARENAIDSSGNYKDAYLANNSYSYTPSTGSSSTPPSSQSKQSGGTDKPSSGSSGSNQSTGGVNSGTNAPSEWELNKAEFDTMVACADRAAANNSIQGAYGSPSYYQQKITQLEAQLVCTDGAKYSMSQQRRTSYQSQIATNKARYSDSINPDSPSYYPNSY